MKISTYNQLLAIATLVSGVAIFATLWNQYQKVEGISRDHYESRLLVQTVAHLFTMSKTWLTTQDLLFTGRQTYLAKGVSEQSSHLIDTILIIKRKIPVNDDKYLAEKLITSIEKNNNTVLYFNGLSSQGMKDWQKNVEKSDVLTGQYVEDLESLSKRVSSNNNHLTDKLALATSDFIALTLVMVLLYILLVLFIVTWFSKYIVRPIEKITELALQPTHATQSIEFRQNHAPLEVVALSAAIQDFTQRITIEKQKLEQERINVIRANTKASVIMDTMPCSVLLVNGQGKITECNNESEQLFEQDKINIIHRKISDFLPALATLTGEFDNDFALKNMEESLLAPCFNNPHIEFSGRKIEIDDTDSYLLTISDINERKHSQRALTALSEQLINAEKLASIGQLSAGIAHEINNPVGYIRSNLEVLNDYFTPMLAYINLINTSDESNAAKILYEEEDLDSVVEDVEPLITSTLEGIGRVSKIIKDLGNYAHVDDKEKETIFIDEVIEKSLTLVANELKYKVDITKCLDARVEVLAFPQKILQVFINMLVNASHAIESQGRISISSFAYQGEVKISFEDNGSGIANEHLKNIFNPFFTTKPVGKGTGLGLHIVRSIIEDHAGRIDVFSEEGKGSKFDIYLPVYNR